MASLTLPLAGRSKWISVCSRIGLGMLLRLVQFLVGVTGSTTTRRTKSPRTARVALGGRGADSARTCRAAFRWPNQDENALAPLSRRRGAPRPPGLARPAMDRGARHRPCAIPGRHRPERGNLPSPSDPCPRRASLNRLRKQSLNRNLRPSATAQAPDAGRCLARLGPVAYFPRIQRTAPACAPRDHKRYLPPWP